MSDLDKCKKYLRSILLASKGGVPGAQVVAKYKDIVGEPVPYRRFNFNSLEEFLQSIPDVCRITVRGREVVVVGVETAETKHIKDLIQRQGGKGKGGGGGRPAPVNVNKYYSSKPQFSQGMNNQNNIRGSGTNVRAPPFAPQPMNRQVPSSYQSKQQPARKPQTFTSPVKVTPKKFTTSPPQVKPNLVSQNFPVTKESVKTWSGRVRKFLEGRQHGLLKTQVERFHEKQYQEKLPDPWADIMLNFGEITMRKEQGNVLVYIIANQYLTSYLSCWSDDVLDKCVHNSSRSSLTQTKHIEDFIQAQGKRRGGRRNPRNVY